MTTVSPGCAVIAVAGCLILCRPAGGEEHRAAVSSRTTAIETAPTSAPSAKPSPTLGAEACKRLRRQVERDLAAAQRCKDTDECIATSFEYAFRPCGLGVRKDASLDEAASHAKRYQNECHPVIHPVKCAYLPRAVCERARCILTAPAEGTSDDK